ncbi:MAG: coproporphyrinogen III oxidase, partial [Oligoflexales bacterium]|nr:coproporphyrinogen III oxidase [Oligoflexales bacterium]
RVQKAVNRIQPFEMVEKVMEKARNAGFRSINFDLIYGLPYQTVSSMEKTLSQVVTLDPDRIAFYRLAVIPEIFHCQKAFSKTDLPEGDLTLSFMEMAADTFQNHGYEFIGLDHFAKDHDPLKTSKDTCNLVRTFQGMTTSGNLCVLGVGPSAISILADSYAQNDKDTQCWLKKLENGFATAKGMNLSKDDLVRKEVMNRLYCHGIVDMKDISEKFEIDFQGYFKDELERIKILEPLGIARTEAEKITLTGLLGRFLVRIAASVFDAYLPPDSYLKGLPNGRGSKIG